VRRRWCGGAEARWTSSPVTGSWRCSGAPTAPEDHAFRASLAALDIQAETAKLAKEVEARDDTALQLQVGMALRMDEIGSGALGYTAVGRHLGPGRSKRQGSRHT
jgi:hypothetical protein